MVSFQVITMTLDHSVIIKILTMVSCNDDERIVENIFCFQPVKDVSDGLVCGRDSSVIQADDLPDIFRGNRSGLTL